MLNDGFFFAERGGVSTGTQNFVPNTRLRNQTLIAGLHIAAIYSFTFVTEKNIGNTFATEERKQRLIEVHIKYA